MTMNSLLNIVQVAKQCEKSSLSLWRQLSTATSLKQKQGVKTGVLMLNMGGPSSLEEVHEYLLRIMTDTNMIQLPFQSHLGAWIAKRRTSKVQERYKVIGGKSPILDWTNKQGKLMCEKLDVISPETAPHKHYVAFRYANPLTADAFRQIEEDGVQHTVVFSQYPQYSCATSGSSFLEIYEHYKGRNYPKDMKWSVIDRWPTHPLFVRTIVERIKEQLAKFPEEIRRDVIILFSAHSLPIQAVTRGDAYPYEVGTTVALVMEQLQHCNPYKLVWQSKVGPLPWLQPFTDNAIKDYVQQGKKHFLLVPVAFVNEHIETLHELDIEYCKELAEELGIERIRRTSAPNDHPLFIDALADIVHSHLKSSRSIDPVFLMRCPRCTNPECCAAAKDWFAKICNANAAG